MTELGEEAEAGIRYGPLSGAMESVIKAKALAHFLRTGALLRRSDVCWASYDEYIPGVIAFANELQRVRCGHCRMLAAVCRRQRASVTHAARLASS